MQADFGKPKQKVLSELMQMCAILIVPPRLHELPALHLPLPYHAFKRVFSSAAAGTGPDLCSCMLCAEPRRA